MAFVAALSGSLHCVGMCGPLRLLTGVDWRNSIAYQSGRLLAYLGIGSAAGAAGMALPPKQLLTGILVLLVIYFAPSNTFGFIGKLRQKTLNKASSRPFTLGIASGLLPCGILHTWVAGAALTGNPAMGALFLFSLWLGTMPALEASSRFLARPLAALRQRFPKALPALLLLLALLPFSLRAAIPLIGSQHSHCHSAGKKP